MPFRGLLDNGLLYHRYEEVSPKEDMRLGRHLWLDARTLSHMVENSISEMSGPLQSVRWDRMLAILDQGNLGSCTGNAGTGALGTEPFYSAVGKAVLPPPGDAAAGEEFAVQLYSDGSKVDEYGGSYPPDDTGSSGLGICKALKNRKTISGYRWSRTAHGFLRLLQKGPVLQGMPWHNAFFEPSGSGAFIDGNPQWSSSGLGGGHEVEAVGVELDTSDAFNSAIVYANSWGPSWGDQGYFRMRLRTYEALDGVDLKQYIV